MLFCIYYFSNGSRYYLKRLQHHPYSTENAQDFCKAGKKHELHENIKDKAEEVSLNYEINIAKFINMIITKHVPNKTDDKEFLNPIKQEIVQKVEKEVTSDCPVCKDPKAELLVIGGELPTG
ncbi:hypothetical protein NX029_02105 [Cytobacillus firmus]|uniref:hypothetical protein n=1 Tax=Cytobacillus TaxID=2675230 RepID=UPI00203F868B|nr:hypothetical protein [Cytobacillus oceanisediminis]MCM3242655.1 hypothetical protein [Cytobacillus oceanisediminis]MCS0822743.1 hypothetical protein [Cytobacillus firmus]